MKVLTVVGARPQFIKAAAVSRVLRARHQELLVHTGQHYDDGMSAVFFRELDIPAPDFNLAVGSGSHGYQTGMMMVRLEELIVSEKPDWVMVYGDTNSTLAGGLAAVKLHVPVAHVEAGLRSFNSKMPEEINRVLVDRISSRLFCSTQTAMKNLRREGITEGIYWVGDVMEEIHQRACKCAQAQSTVLERMNLSEHGYLLATVHRAENVDDPQRLGRILTAFEMFDETVIFPVHPRTRNALDKLNYFPCPHIRIIDPVGYLDMVCLQKSARMILTDSGGIQKEAYWLGVPCITLRDETEWVETVHVGWNRVVGTDAERIKQAVTAFQPPPERPAIFGPGDTSRRIVEALESNLIHNC